MKESTKIIEKIKLIISECGSFTTADIQATSSPVIKTLGKDTCQLAESFYKDKVEAVIYVHDNETSTDFLLYENLELDVLNEILELAKEYEKQQIEENS